MSRVMCLLTNIGELDSGHPCPGKILVAFTDPINIELCKYNCFIGNTLTNTIGDNSYNFIGNISVNQD